MSAIWGAIDFSGEAILEESKELLKDSFKDCVIDRFEELSEKDVYFGCGIQYFTPESKFEKLPYSYDQKLFVADAVLDNRDEVCNRIGLKNEPELPDGEIIRQAYEKLGEKSLNLMRGAYVFVRFDYSTGNIDIVCDAAGNRFVYYLFKDNVFYFASLMKPLEGLLRERKLNKVWLSDFLGCDGLSVFETCEDTSLEGIDRIAPATKIVVNSGKVIEKKVYWDVYSYKHKEKTKTDKEYKKEFVDLYRACVEDAIRTEEEVAIFLSSGYDSTSVACLAAPILKEKGKKLYSFTSVPASGYVSDRPDHMAADESDIVKKTAEFLENLEPEFLELKDINLWDARKEYMKVCEVPYKSPENMLWLYEGHRKAREKGARIILSGAFGNGTVSFDNSTSYLVWLVRHLRLRTYNYEVNALAKRYGADRRKIHGFVIKGFFNVMSSDRKSKAYDYSYIDKDFLISSGVKNRIMKSDRNYKKSYYNPQKIHDCFLTRENFRHYGEFAQKHSLYSGVILRDPTRDIRLVQFVKELPHDQFFHNGYKRRLIRDYCRDFMPADYFIHHPIGVQSADVKFRFEQIKDSLIPEWKEMLEKSDFKGVIDKEKLTSDLNSKDVSEMLFFDTIRLFYTMNLLEYIQNCKM